MAHSGCALSTAKAGRHAAPAAAVAKKPRRVIIVVMLLGAVGLRARQADRAPSMPAGDRDPGRLVKALGHVVHPQTVAGIERSLREPGLPRGVIGKTGEGRGEGV